MNNSEQKMNISEQKRRFEFLIHATFAANLNIFNMKRITSLLVCVLIGTMTPLSVSADQPPEVYWESRGGRSIGVTVTVDNGNMYVWSPDESSVLISISDKHGMQYEFEVVASPNEPGVLSLHDLPAGVYDVVVTSDDGMTTHGVLTIQ